MGPPSMSEYAPAAGTAGYCDTVVGAGCAWIADTTADWINLSTGTGSGNGRINFTLQNNVLMPARTATIFLRQNTTARCTINQRGGLLRAEAADTPLLTSDLDLEGGEAQVTIDGTSSSFQRRGARDIALAAGRQQHRVEAVVVSAAGPGGSWRFRLGAVAPGTLRIVAGSGAVEGDTGLVFRLSGKPGERLVFLFRSPGD